MKQELDTYIRARYPLLWIVTPEEQRALLEIEELAKEQKKRLWTWSISRGLENPAQPAKNADKSKRDPLAMLSSIISETEAGIWILRDFHPYLKDHTVVRMLREISTQLGSSNKTVILLGPVLKIPSELEKDLTVVDFALPDESQIQSMIEAIIERAKESGRVDIKLDKRERSRLVKASLGLTETEASNAIAKAIILAKGHLNGDAIEAVTAEKQQIIRKSGLLEFYNSDDELTSVGGLHTLKEWLRKRVRAFSDEARRFGLFASLVGSSEENLRNAIKIAESIAPVVLWVDEIEKGFSGVGSSNVSDAGTSARVFGSFITWLQEKKSPVFVIATANSVTQLPPELVRKGRFDEIFFVDLPSSSERADIWKIHLEKRNRAPAEFDLHSLAMASDGLSGAEIEQALIAGLYEAFDQNRPLHENDLLDVLRDTVPLSRMMEEEIDRLRAWSEQRARKAS